jgi:hypothetical protein
MYDPYHIRTDSIQALRAWQSLNTQSLVRFIKPSCLTYLIASSHPESMGKDVIHWSEALFLSMYDPYHIHTDCIQALRAWQSLNKQSLVRFNKSSWVTNPIFSDQPESMGTDVIP